MELKLPSTFESYEALQVAMNSVIIKLNPLHYRRIDLSGRCPCSGWHWGLSNEFATVTDL